MHRQKASRDFPPPSDGDIFLDFEGDPFAGEGGIEYLTGVVTAKEDGSLAYECRWATDRAQERAAFEWFIDFTFEQMTRHGDLHIYHFGSYEPSALKRLILRYATREEEVDRLLRGIKFIDLHGIIKQGLRASVEQYSLKDLERFCSYSRNIPLAEANHTRHFIEHQLELSPSPELTDESIKLVEGTTKTIAAQRSAFETGLSNCARRLLRMEWMCRALLR